LICGKNFFCGQIFLRKFFSAKFKIFKLIFNFSVCATSKIISVDKNVLRKVSLPQWRKSSISVQRKNEGDKVKTTLTVIVDEGDTELVNNFFV